MLLNHTVRQALASVSQAGVVVGASAAGPTKRSMISRWPIAIRGTAWCAI